MSDLGAERHAVVIGAGLAGAAVTHALALRGWSITLIERGERLASGASDLPVGVLSPHRTAQPTPMSRLTALGLPVTKAHLQQYLPDGRGWHATQIANCVAADGGDTVSVVDHDDACIVVPAALIAAWIGDAQRVSQITIRTGCAVGVIEALTPLQTDSVGAPRWRVLDRDRATICDATHVVVCAAFDSAALLPNAPLGLRPVAGQMTMGAVVTRHKQKQDTTNAEPTQIPKRLSGVFVPYFHTPRGAVWSIGATYRRSDDDCRPRTEDREHNADLLRRLAPEALDEWEIHANAGTLIDWVGVRCASIDRLPLVGALPLATPSPVDPSLRRAQVKTAPGLFGLMALGSRGLSLAPLLGMVLADQMCGEAHADTPALLPPDLMDAIDPRRAPLQEARQAVRKMTRRTRAT